MKLKEHLHKSRLTSNAAVLLTWILLSGCEGRLGANIEDLMLGLGWSRSMVRRSLAELVSKGYASFCGAANKQGLGTIRILKFDLLEPIQSTSEPGTPAHRSTGEPSESAHPNAELTSEPSTGRLDSTQLTGEPGVPTELSAQSTGEPSKAYKEIPAGCRFSGKLSDVACQTLRYLRFDPAPWSLSRGFVNVVEWLGKRQHLPLPGILATMILDRCLFQQRKRKADGKNPSLYLFPPGLQRHRDALRKKELEAGRKERQRAA